MSEDETQKATSAQWRFWIDRGGTFTDVIGLSPQGELHQSKVFSASLDLHAQSESSVMGMLQIFDQVGEKVSIRDLPERVSEVRVGTTVATNALLERRGAPVGLLITQGFRDLLYIGDQTRPDLFALKIERPLPLYQKVFEVEERLSATGEVIAPLERSPLYTCLERWKGEGIESLAVVLLHSTLNPVHELEVEKIAQELDFQWVTLSHRSAPLPRAVTRGNTTVLDAYLNPPLHDYIDRLSDLLRGVPLRLMTSSGGLVSPERMSGSSALLSGPAGGVIGAIEAINPLDVNRCVGLDIGGTSADVFFWEGSLERSRETTVSGLKVQLPTLKIHTVASGGGSIISLQGGQLRVGPRSAGSDPGPACYGRGGPATLTDANLILGRITPEALPPIFGPTGAALLDLNASYIAMRRLLSESGSSGNLEDFALDITRIAEEEMAQAIRQITLAKGKTLEGATLVAFGGAGGQHACAVADLLGIKSILIHASAGLLSAWGIGHAPIIKIVQQSIDLRLDHEIDQQVTAMIDGLKSSAIRTIVNESQERGDLKLTSLVHAQLGRSEASFEIEWQGAERSLELLRGEHEARFGYPPPLEQFWRLNLLRVVGELRLTKPRQVKRDQERVQRIGPALLPEPHGAIYVHQGWSARALDQGGWLIEKRLSLPEASSAGPLEMPKTETSSEFAELAVFQNRLMAIAEEMGIALQQSAQSVNIRERLDYSCALFTEEGELIAHAPHIPVHLGSMSSAVQAARRRWPHLREGDVVILNSPMEGGTHLPDVTVMTALAGVGWLAARGHHADVGGITSGSMPASSRSLAEEGVILDGFLLRDGRFEEASLRARLNQEPWPARHPQQNLDDLRAQLAALSHGQKSLMTLVKQEGKSRVISVMARLLDVGERSARQLLPQIRSASICRELDDGSKLSVSVSTLAEGAEPATVLIDFTGTSATSPHNRNAPPSVTRSAVLYVLRLLLGPNVPLNDGLLRAVRIELPAGSLLSPPPEAAVVAGNVETSQAIVDILLEVFALQANSQGTMNNLTLGTPTQSYYETICGGTGAGFNYHGESGVHSHMTNSRLTDPEVFEALLPLRLVEFSLRSGSAGRGLWRGGEGVKRVFLAEDHVDVSIVSSRRLTQPQGLEGGEAGASGENWLQRAGERDLQSLSGDVTLQLSRGDLLFIYTPGGGGYGAPLSACSEGE